MGLSQFKIEKIKKMHIKAWDFYRTGLSTREIGKLMGKSHTWVWNAIKERVATKSVDNSVDRNLQ